MNIRQSKRKNVKIKMALQSLSSGGKTYSALLLAKGLNNGDFSKAISTENGVVVLNLINLTKAPEIADYTSYKNTLEQGMQSRTSYYVSESIKEWAAIEDSRYKFY